MDIESKDFRRVARNNCYEYGCLRIYRENIDVRLDEHKFPHYSLKNSTGAVEKFLSLLQSLGDQAKGNDSSDKISKPVPGVNWENDSFDLSIDLDGIMYFTDYRDYETIKNKLRKDLVSQGWEQSVHEGALPITTYRPGKHGDNALYNDDPTDAAGFAMMTQAVQHTADQARMLYGYMTNNADSFAKGYARFETTSKATGGLIGETMYAGAKALASNMNAGILGKWKTSGKPVTLIIDGQPCGYSVPMILTSASFIEQAFVIDNDQGIMYPTELKVNIGLTNLYGALLNTSSVI